VRRRSFVHLALLAAVIAAATTAIAVAIPWLPVSASKERDRIDLVYWLATAIAILIFSVVAAAILYSVFRFRVRADDDSDGPPIHGHTGLEIVWTAIPTALVTAIAIVSAIVLHDNGLAAGKDPLQVKVTAEQFTWVFGYENGEAKGVVAPDLYLQVNRSVKLVITSKDVLHSFWVPEFGQKQDAVPGRNNTLIVTPTKVGTYPVICTELCGLGHALMRRSAIVMTAANFKTWAQKAQSGAPSTPPPSPSPSPSPPPSPPQTSPSPSPPPAPSGGTQSSAAGKSVFTANGCASCHTLTAAGATGTVGPNLDQLPAEAQRAGQPLEAFVRQSIVDPEAYIEPSYPKGVMPGNFGSTITKSDLDALVQYLIASSKGG
jgi:cytochrome c oxidase subunit 2